MNPCCHWSNTAISSDIAEESGLPTIPTLVPHVPLSTRSQSDYSPSTLCSTRHDPFLAARRASFSNTLDQQHSHNKLEPPPGTYKGTYRKPICRDAFTNSTESSVPPTTLTSSDSIGTNDDIAAVMDNLNGTSQQRYQDGQILTSRSLDRNSHGETSNNNNLDEYLARMLQNEEPLDTFVPQSSSLDERDLGRVSCHRHDNGAGTYRHLSVTDYFRHNDLHEGKNIDFEGHSYMDQLETDDVIAHRLQRNDRKQEGTEKQEECEIQCWELNQLQFTDDDIKLQQQVAMLLLQDQRQAREEQVRQDALLAMTLQDDVVTFQGDNNRDLISSRSRSSNSILPKEQILADSALAIELQYKMKQLEDHERECAEKNDAKLAQKLWEQEYLLQQERQVVDNNSPIPSNHDQIGRIIHVHHIPKEIYVDFQQNPNETNPEYPTNNVDVDGGKDVLRLQQQTCSFPFATKEVPATTIENQFPVGDSRSCERRQHRHTMIRSLIFGRRK
jgi:hypothetical protein